MSHSIMRVEKTKSWAVLPTPSKAGFSGFDIVLPKDTLIDQEYVNVQLGFSVDLPWHVYLRDRCPSGLYHKHKVRTAYSGSTLREGRFQDVAIWVHNPRKIYKKLPAGIVIMQWEVYEPTPSKRELQLLVVPARFETDSFTRPWGDW